MLRVRFRGVRGSVPLATPSGIGHGCNTPCIEITDPTTGAILILDAGSGIVGIDMDSHGPPRRLPLLLTHYHWDHLLGLPFFGALYQPGWEVVLHTPALEAHDPRWLDTLFRSPFFPVPYQHLPNRPSCEMVSDGVLSIAGFEVRACPLNHPGGALAYRIRGGRGDLLYATDHEFGNEAIDAVLGDFARGAAAMILDAHFTPAELPRYRGWGHSDWRQCAEFAAAHDAGALWLFHHKPVRSDEELIEIRAQARSIFGPTDTASEQEGFEV